ncbi:beta-lactamase family protein [Kibdelosporangium philippinense]|uniref:Beta-lactamase family protein n=1 Tax=Kibdelosporangium philippinense TaxID=211113 RepID=A0ABS8ZMT9_9PSEU|nr:serine hydrolase domain-containing protein [Kibdelosporangium philippinense]MCE7007773.1 beta-lactamase family protein [Kibdelosporangium philippinense]
MINGHTAPGFEAVRAAFEANFAAGAEVGAAVSVYLHGKPVVDLWGGMAYPGTNRLWERDTLQVIFSTTKAATATCLLLLAERGEVDLDAPVADYWPEFAAAGKDRLMVRWLLTHQAGLAALDKPIARADALAWHPMVKALAAQRPLWEPGTDHGYHALTFGWLVGEVVRRVSGRSLGGFFRDEIAGPLDLDFHIGLPHDDLDRVSRLVMQPPTFGELPEEMRELAAAFMDSTSLTRRAYGCVEPAFDHNSPADQVAEIPATNGICTARALAGFYAGLIGNQILRPETIKMATIPQTSGPDLVTRRPFHVGLGFGLPTPTAAWYSPTAFGFSGLGGSIGYADPETGIAFGYVMNHVRSGPDADEPAARLSKAVNPAGP